MSDQTLPKNAAYTPAATDPLTLGKILRMLEGPTFFNRVQKTDAIEKRIC